MTKRGHKCDDCKDGKCGVKELILDKSELELKPLTENMVTVEWDFNTYELCIMIKPKQYLLQDIAKPDEITDAEAKARAHLGMYAELIKDTFNKELKNK